MKPSDDAPQINMEAVALLRKRVEQAVGEIKRLRKENASLRDEIKALASNAEKTQGALTLFGDEESPGELKKRIQGFIATIDGILGDDEHAETLTNGQTA